MQIKTTNTYSVYVEHSQIKEVMQEQNRQAREQNSSPATDTLFNELGIEQVA